MKRSEMYELMCVTFLNELKDYDKITTADVVVHMDKVLGVIEEVGMLPPPNRVDVLNGIKLELLYNEDLIEYTEDYDFIKVRWDEEND